MKLMRSAACRLAGLVVGVGVLTSPNAVFAATSVPPRIVQSINGNDRIVLTGNTHPLARPEFDRGAIDPTTRLDRMILVLQRSPDQERALAAFNERQQDPFSVDYHHWLNAGEFGELYGPADADIAAVTAWLKTQGFEIYHVNEGGISIEFSGTAAAVQRAFVLEMHRYVVAGVEHIANDRDPQIPRALAPVVAGVASLHDFRPAPLTVYGARVKRDRLTGRITPVEPRGLPATGVEPQYGYVGNDGLQHEDVTPYDFATIYNSLPLWKAGTPIIGTGITVAIAGGSDINLDDVATFRKTFGLPARAPAIIHNGAAPGIADDASENTLDVEMAGAAAPGADVTLVASATTSTTPGFELSLQYIVSKQTAPIMSASYGTCELQLGKTGNAFFNTLYQQGATEGITIFISSGDQGSAGCDFHDTYPDEIGLAVNGMASSPYVTAVGGTDFTWSFTHTAASTYWNSMANADGATAKGYIPEVPWNSTCGNPLLLNVFVDANGGPEFADNEALCNFAAQNGSDEGLVGISAGSGGVSNCTEPTGSTTSTCAGGYAKPTWQTGAGVPADGRRDLPDVSMFSSLWNAGGINGSAILFCDSVGGSNGCDYGDPDYVVYQEIGGTSAASPYMAGVMAMVLQKAGGARQGLANPTLYKLASRDTLSSCQSTSVKSGNACVFYDQTSGSIAQACYTGGPGCVTATSGHPLGLLSGYAATTGYDRATGLGSVNIANLVDEWASTVPNASVSVSPASLTFASTKVGATSAAQAVTVKNTGSVPVTLTSGGIGVSGSDATSFVKSSTTCAASLAVGAGCTVTVAFKPAVAGSLHASLTIADSASAAPQSVALTGTATSPSPAAALTLSATAEAFGDQTVNTASAARTITAKNTGTAPLTLTSIALSGGETDDFVLTKSCGSTLAAGASCALSVTFKPIATGAKHSSVVIANNAPGSPQFVALSGTGMADANAAGAAAVKMSAASEAFGTVAVDAASATRSITVTNGGTSVLALKSIVLSGGERDDFVLTKTCGSTLAAGTGCTVSVTFKPIATGAKHSSVAITDDAAGSPQVIPLTGTGK